MSIIVSSVDSTEQASAQLDLSANGYAGVSLQRVADAAVGVAGCESHDEIASDVAWHMTSWGDAT